MEHLSPELLGLATLVLGTIGSAIAWIVRRRDRYVEKLERENEAYRARIDALQDRQYETLIEQIRLDNERVGLNRWLARTIEEHSARLKRISRDREDGE